MQILYDYEKDNIVLCTCGNVLVLLTGCQNRSAYGGASGESRSTFHGQAEIQLEDRIGQAGCFAGKLQDIGFFDKGGPHEK